MVEQNLAFELRGVRLSVSKVFKVFLLKQVE